MILLDNCVSLKLKNLLKSWNYSVTTVSEHISADSTDIDVIGLAMRLKAVLLTVDMDFSNILDYPPDQFNGIIVVRYQATDEPAVIQSLHQALSDLYPENLAGILVIVTPYRYRIRRSDG